MLFRFGKSTYVETYTPDSDGIIRIETDSSSRAINKGGSFHKFFTSATESNVYEQAKDMQNAMADPKNNFRLISAKSLFKVF